jgi:hypothetical protein
MEYREGIRHHSNLETLRTDTRWRQGCITWMEYMTQPQGFEVEEQGDLVCKLERALYRLSNLDELVTETET